MRETERTFSSREVAEILIEKMGYNNKENNDFEVNWKIERNVDDNRIQVILKATNINKKEMNEETSDEIECDCKKGMGFFARLALAGYHASDCALAIEEYRKKYGVLNHS